MKIFPYRPMACPLGLYIVPWNHLMSTISKMPTAMNT